MAAKKENKKITTPEFRVSFPAVFEPVSFEGGAAKYKVNMLFLKGTDLTQMIALATATADEKWPDKSKRPANLRNPFRDGDVEKPETEGYIDHMFVAATSKIKPGVVDLQVQDIINQEEFYAGCYAIATVTCYAYNTAGNAGVAFGLQNIQKKRDGEPFSGRADPSEEFEAVASDAPDGAAEGVQESTSIFG